MTVRGLRRPCRDHHGNGIARRLQGRPRLIDAAMSGMGAALFCLDWINSVGLTVQDHVQNALLMIFTVLLPFNPTICSIIITLLSLAMAYALPAATIYWLFSTPCLLALIFLAKSVRRPIPTAIIFFIMQLLAATGTITHNEELRSLILGYQPLIIAWAIGTLLGCAIEVQRKRTIAEEKASHRSEQLRVLHVLHDSVANDLVYAVTQCKSLRTELTDRGSIAKTDDVITALESGLAQLRQQIIEPAKRDIETIDKPGTDAGHIQTPDTQACIHSTMRTIEQRLRQCGFAGKPQISGNLSVIREEVIDVIDMTIHELGGNIIKYGEPGAYALAINVSADGTVTIVSSNRYRPRTDAPCWSSTSDTCHTPILLSNRLRSIGGSMSVSREDGEWTACVCIPDAYRDKAWQHTDEDDNR